jgi:serine/threonine protein kinase
MIPLHASDPVAIGDFQLLARLGGGGMGQLYLGRRPDGSTAAVKVIRSDLAHQKDFRARFRREIAAAGQADGPFTARVLAADPDGIPPWLAVEYIAGPSLLDAVEQHGKLPEQTVRALMAGLAAGLVHLHQLGLVHRDLKPGNVLLAANGPRIIDFGVSRVLDSSTITQTGQLLGSPGFMSPEQAVGTSPAGPPTDVFALGALMSYVLTGSSLFGTGQTPAIVYRIVHEQPSLDGVPESMRELLTECLAKDPADRPTARQVCDRLAAVDFSTTSWLPDEVSADIERRRAELAAADSPLRDESAETMLRPRPVATPAVAEPRAAAPGRAGRRAALVAGVAALVVLAGGGTALALRSSAGPGSAEKPPTVASLSVSPSPGVSAATATASATATATAPSSATSPSAVSPPGGGRPTAPQSTAVVVQSDDQQQTGGGGVPVQKPTTRATPKATPKAAPKAAADGSSCFATAVRGSFDLKNGVTVAGGPNYTSSSCRDIHIKLTTAITWTYARSCLETADGSRITKCSGWVFLSYPESWDTLSRSVPGGTRWQLQMYALGDGTVRFSYTA